MKSILLLLCFLTCCGSLPAQDAGKQKDKKEKSRPKATKPQPAKPPLVAPAIQWNEIERLFRVQRNVPNPGPVVRVVNNPGGPVVLGGNNIVISDQNDQMTFEKFVNQQVGLLDKTCKLSPEQKRKIELAAKGVIHRKKVRTPAPPNDKPEPAAPNINLGMRVLRFTPVSPTKDFPKQLKTSKLWTKTLEKVLTKQQQAAWKNRPAPEPAKPIFRLQPRPLPQNPGVLIIQRLNNIRQP